jgi:hypothetical protein
VAFTLTSTELIDGDGVDDSPLTLLNVEFEKSASIMILVLD